MRGQRKRHPVKVLDDVPVAFAQRINVLNGAGELCFPVNKQHADFSFLRPGHLRGEMQHDGGVFAAREGDADAGKGGERPADALLRGLQHVKLQGIFIQ